MAFAGAATDPVGSISESDIDSYWATQNSKDATSDVSNYNDMDYYFRTVVCAGIPSGHTCKWGVNDAGTKYFLTISGPNINKTWS
jgi:hypothetical protein